MKLDPVGNLQPDQYSRLQSDLEHLDKAQTGARVGTANGSSDVDSLLSRADALPPSPKRDYLYYMAAMAAVRKNSTKLRQTSSSTCLQNLAPRLKNSSASVSPNSSQMANMRGRSSGQNMTPT